VSSLHFLVHYEGHSFEEECTVGEIGVASEGELLNRREVAMRELKIHFLHQSHGECSSP
jgi:hypothetical protein